ncbi:MAG: hypothetical protein MUC87_13800 [Bacteroidia bacterium]|jgi:hypothetical protein|nr:hypothetical protein [Bacteroidia bacterium]
MLTIILFGCKRNDEVEPIQTNSTPAINRLHKFWYYKGGKYEIGGNDYPLMYRTGRFLYLPSQGNAVVAMNAVVGNSITECEIYHTTYREINGGIILSYDTCSEFSDSLFYIKYISDDSLALRTRGYRNQAPQNTDSVYCELYFHKTP